MCCDNFVLIAGLVCDASPTGVAAFNDESHTLHSLLNLPKKGEIKDLQGERLGKIQQALAGTEYLIIDEMSMVGKRMFGQIDRRLHQVFTHRSDQVLGGGSVLLFGDFGQLPPVIDLPLYTTCTRSAISDIAYQSVIQPCCSVGTDNETIGTGSESRVAS